MVNGRHGEAVALYERERRHLLGVAYRLLGSMSDAEDVLQDVFERWVRSDRSEVSNPSAFLTTMTTRRSLDLLRSARRSREVYVGPWLPEPVVLDDDGPAALAELDESLTIGYLYLQERLSPTERAVHLLHDVYDFPFREIADMIATSEVNCRQLAVRARRKLAVSRPERVTACAPNEADAAVTRLVAAVTGGDVDEVVALLADDVVHVSDGGPHRRAARHPVTGAERVARQLVNLTARIMSGTGAVAVSQCRVNGEPGVLVAVDHAPVVVMVAEFDQHRVSRLWAVLNPDKFGGLSAVWPS